MSLMRGVLLTLSRSDRIRRMAMGFGPIRALARRFVAGETLDEAVVAMRDLNAQDLLGTLDRLGENVSLKAETHAAADATVMLLDAIEENNLRSGASIKLSQMGLDLSLDLAVENVERILFRAADANRFVRIDMEGFDYVQPTLDLFEKLWRRHKNVGVVIQSYLYRSVDDVARLIEMGASVRLVKGAYDEPPEVAYPKKADTDANFVRLMEMLFSKEARTHGVFPAIATHDEHLIDWAKAHARNEGISKDRFEFQMLYGIRTRLQRQLVAEGYRVRTYVPYGDQWYPYFMRRLAERPANVFFLLRHLFRA